MRKSSFLLSLALSILFLTGSCDRIENEDPVPDYDFLCFTAEEAGSTVSVASMNVDYWYTVDTIKQGSIPQDIEYSIDAKEWKKMLPNVTVTLKEVGDKVFLRGNNPEHFNVITQSADGSYRGQLAIFQMTGRIAASGNIMTLIDGKGETVALPQNNVGCFSYLFNGCESLVRAPDLPATELVEQCYSNMFSFTSLTEAPELPATNLKEGCYSSMFHGCVLLSSAPALPAMKLAPYCYEGMFDMCFSLREAPALPAVEVAPYCYHGMFYSCESLVSSPAILPAKNLAPYCYWQMFSECSSIEKAPALPAEKLEPYCYTMMFNGCRSMQQAPELPATELAFGCYANMFTECMSLKSAPVLPAGKLVDNCYYGMFFSCLNLNYVKALFEMTDEELTDNSYTDSWLGAVAAKGMLVKSRNATWTLTGLKGAPEGWTVIIE